MFNNNISGMREDIRNCFKVCDYIEKRFDKKIDDVSDKVNTLERDMSVMANSVKTLADSLEKHLDDSDKIKKEIHTRMDDIEKVQSKVVKGIYYVLGGSSFLYVLYELGIIVIKF